MSPSEEILSVKDLVPHTGEVVLLDHIHEIAPGALRASTIVRADGLFNVNKEQVPAFIGVEYMAQAIAAWAGWHGRKAGEAIKPGLLLGVREFTASEAYFPVGTQLEISIERVLEMENGLAVFDCSITGQADGAAISLSARLSVLTIDSLSDLQQ